MRNFLKFASLAVVAIAGFTFTSCSDDDEPNNGGGNTGSNIEEIFEEGLPAAVDGATFTTNEKGQLTKIVDGTTNVTFEYGTFTPPSRAHNFTVRMKERDSQNPNDGWDIYLELNKQGYVAYAYQYYLDVDVNDEYYEEGDEYDEWWFEYNNAGQLTRLKRSESNEEWKLAYSNGDVATVVKNEKDGDTRTYTFAYTNSEYKNVIANKGCLMLFDDNFQLEMDEMNVAYYAGLLGKAVKNLPVGYVRKGVEGGDEYTDEPVAFQWTLNSNGLPTKFWDGYDLVTFTW